jgi:hypothetical protein
MAEAVDTAKDFLGGLVSSGKSTGAGFISMFAWVILFVIIICILGVVIFFVLRGMKFNKKIVLFEEINGVFCPTRNDRASEVKLSTGGDTIFYALKHKKYLPNPSIQTGPRTFWYFIRSDGEWINFGLQNLNELSRQVGARFLDKEMRYARTQIQKGLKERYDKPGFWQQYGMMIMNIAWIAMIGVMTYLLFDKWIDLAGATNAGVEQAGKVMEQVLTRTDEVLSKLDNVCSGSGIR